MATRFPSSSRTTNPVPKKKIEILAIQDQDWAMYFDLPTPRPHLIVVHKPRITFTEFTADQDLQASFFQFLENDVRPYLDMAGEEFSLSFHVGKFASDNSFHAHICLPQAKYVDLLHRSDHSSLKRMQSWKVPAIDGDSHLQHYIRNVEAYKEISLPKMRKYLLEDIQMGENNLASPHQVIGDSPFSLSWFYPRVLHLSSPRSSDREVFSNLLAKAIDLGLNRGGLGCHLVVFLDGPRANRKEYDKDDKDVSGYLQVGCDLFVKYLPVGERRTWLSEVARDINPFIST